MLGPIHPTDITFDTRVYNGEYLYLRGDSSVGTGKLSAAGIPYFKDGQSILDHGPGTLWEEGAPRIHYPLLIPPNPTTTMSI